MGQRQKAEMNSKVIKIYIIGGDQRFPLSI